jgi:hypothetical protein
MLNKFKNGVFKKIGEKKTEKNSFDEKKKKIMFGLVKKLVPMLLPFSTIFALFILMY